MIFAENLTADDVAKLISRLKLATLI